jgi:hypothetical protein
VFFPGKIKKNQNIILIQDFKKNGQAVHQWLMPVIPATQGQSLGG